MHPLNTSAIILQWCQPLSFICLPMLTCWHVHPGTASLIGPTCQLQPPATTLHGQSSQEANMKHFEFRHNPDKHSTRTSIFPEVLERYTFTTILLLCTSRPVTKVIMSKGVTTLLVADSLSILAPACPSLCGDDSRLLHSLSSMAVTCTTVRTRVVQRDCERV